MKFTDILDDDPDRALQTITDDLCMRLRQQGCKAHSIEGVQIAMQIAYRLGERCALQKGFTIIADKPNAG